MAPRGPKPKPTALKRAQGNPGKRALNAHEPEFNASMPEPPAHLTAVALEEWNRMAPELYKARVLTQADRMALAAYCQAFSDWVGAREEIAVKGFTITTEKGNLIQSPWVGIANRAMNYMIRIAAEFGMTPSSRTRVTAQTTDPRKKLDKFREKAR